MIKQIFILLVLIIFAKNLSGQNKEEVSIYNNITNKDKVNDKINIYLNMQSVAKTVLDKGITKLNFNTNDFRIFITGSINPWLSYKYQQRFTQRNDFGPNADNLPRNVDVAGIGIKFNDKLNMFVGKQCIAYAGIEFDYIPHEIYQFSDMLDNMTCYMSGLGIEWNVNRNNVLKFQVLNSFESSFEHTYKLGVNQHIEEAKIPLSYTLNWTTNNGIGDLGVKTNLSATIFTEAKDNYMYYFAMGNEFTYNRFNMYVDVMYSREDIDDKGIISRLIKPYNGGELLCNLEYISFVSKITYGISSKWKIFTKFMYETGGIHRAYEGVEAGVYRTSYGYIGGIEYYPDMKYDIHFFANYIGRYYDNHIVQNNINNSNANSISIGLICRLKLY